MYINIDNELLFKELTFLNRSHSNTVYWKRYKPSVSDIDRLFSDYVCTEYCENFYDSEPHYDDEEFNMYMDYCDIIRKGNITNELVHRILFKSDASETYSKEKHSLRELRKAYRKILKQQKEFNKYRIRFNNWQEPYFMGNWVSKDKATVIAKDKLYAIRSESVHKKDRFWILEYDVTSRDRDCSTDICIYYYGRDYLLSDYVWFFEKKNGD